MKTQRRHELETNQLADWFGHNIEQIKSYARTGGIVLVGIILIVLAGMIYRNNRAEGEAAAWRFFFNAFSENSPDALEKLADNPDFRGANVSAWAKELAAEAKLERGMTSMFTDRVKANELLGEAEKMFKGVESSASGNRQLLERSRFGLAQTFEATNQLDSAKKYYGLVAKATPDSVLGKAAASALTKIEDPEMIAFHEWFSKQRPKTPQPILNGPGSSPLLGPGGADALKDLPKTSDLPSLEKELGLPKFKSPDESTEDKAPQGDAKPVEPSPSGEKPAEEKKE